MKLAILVGCLALGFVGCSSYRGGTGTTYETQYGTGWSSDPVYYGPTDTIYPVRKQPSIQGEEMGGVKPLIDPYRQWDMDYTTRPIAPSHGTTVYRTETLDDQPNAYTGRDPIFNR